MTEKTTDEYNGSNLTEAEMAAAEGFELISEEAEITTAESLELLSTEDLLAFFANIGNERSSEAYDMSLSLLFHEMLRELFSFLSGRK